MVTIRPAVSDDGDALVAVHVAAIRERGPAAYDADQVGAWAAGKDPDGYPVGDDDAHFVVAVADAERSSASPASQVRQDDGEVVGFAHLAYDESEVRAVYVHPDHDRAGVGSALLEHLERTAVEAGLAELTLLASKNAVGFYERRGYEAREAVDHESTGGVVLECVRMEKRLANRS